MPYNITVTFEITNSQELRLNPTNDFLRNNFENIIANLLNQLIADSNFECEKVKISYQRDFVKFIKSGNLMFINVPEINTSKINEYQSLLTQRALNLIESMKLNKYLKVTSTFGNEADHIQTKTLLCSQFFKNAIDVSYQRDYHNNLEGIIYVPNINKTA